jgi:hypothetical protein
MYPSNSVFLADAFSSHFELTNMISTYIENFFYWKNDPNSPDFEFLKFEIANVL